MDIEYINIKDIKPAKYNPGVISDEQFLELQNSMKDIGFIIPILVNRSNRVIIAGHQRTKAATAIGIETVPVFFIENLTPGDEITFNQLHNGCDKHEDKKVNADCAEYGFTTLDCSGINVETGRNAIYIKEICRLIVKYGNCLCAIICDGEVITQTCHRHNMSRNF